MAAANPATPVISSAPRRGHGWQRGAFYWRRIGAVSAVPAHHRGTLNPVQMAINLGIVEGEVSNLRKFKRNGEPMEHGTKFGHTWYNTDAYCNGKYIDFAGTQKTVAQQEKSTDDRQ